MSQEAESCGRRFARRVNADEWLNLVEAHTVSDRDLYNRLKSNWSAVGSVSGLVAGFTYIASNTDIEFTQNGPLSDHRIHYFGLLSMLSFIVALQATLFSSGLYGMVNILGVDNVNWFVKQNWYLIDVPLVLCITAIGLMLISALVSIGGIVYNWVYWILFSIGLCSSLCFALIFWRIQRQMYARTLYLRTHGGVDPEMAGHKKNDDSTVTNVIPDDDDEGPENMEILQKF